MARPEPRFRVDFQLFVSWQDKRGMLRRAAGHCFDLSASGARVETREELELRSSVLVTSNQFGRMGNATIRYCRREGMKYIAGLQFSTAFGLSDPVRKAMLDKVLLKSPNPGSDINPAS